PRRAEDDEQGQEVVGALLRLQGRVVVEMHRLTLAAVTDAHPAVGARLQPQLAAADGRLVAAGDDDARVVALGAIRERLLVALALPAQLHAAVELGGLDGAMVLADDDLQFQGSTAPRGCKGNEVGVPFTLPRRER